MGDTSKRQLYLPAAGTYIIAIADSRSLFLQGGAAGSPTAGVLRDDRRARHAGADAAHRQPVTGTIGGEVQFYQPAMGKGINDVQLDMPQTQANASVITINAAELKGFADEGNDIFGGPLPAATAAGGFYAKDWRSSSSMTRTTTRSVRRTSR